MTAPTYTPEQAQALAQQYDLLVHETVDLDHAWEIAEHVHIERIRRAYEWSEAEGMAVPPPCCPVDCGHCDEPHSCFDEDVHVHPYPEGLEWSDDHGVLAQVPFEVLWANDETKTEALIVEQVEMIKDLIRARAERTELAERAHLAELQHKYEDMA